MGVYCLNYVRGVLKVRGPGLSELKRQGGAFIDAYGASQLATLPTGDSSVVRWFGNRSTQTSVWHSIQERLKETTGLHRIKTLRTVDLRVFIQIVNIGSRSKNNLHEIELIDEQTMCLQATLLTGFSTWASARGDHASCKPVKQQVRDPSLVRPKDRDTP